jgi:hypothetical protein
MGRKGIGKLAGFGIAENIVLRSVKDNHVVQFTLNYSELRSKADLSSCSFRPEMNEASPDPSGVTVIFKNLKITQKINLDEFRRSMARRFALNAQEMKIGINEIELDNELLEFEYREPKEGWTEYEVPGFGKVSAWFGFLKSPIADPELRGISVFARSRIAQVTPFFFNLSGGINGQVGLEYLTGQVRADLLDDDIDYVATDRQGVNWQFEKPKILERWGLNKVKQLCIDWKKRRTERKTAKVRPGLSALAERIKGLPEQERDDLEAALVKVAEMERIDEREFEIIANSMVAGVERESVKKVIKKINAASETALDELMAVVQEWDIISAVSIAEVVVGKIDIIKQFRKYIQQRLPEKAARGQADMQTFIQDHPWLLGQAYEHLQPADFYHEMGVDKWINDVVKDVDSEYKKADMNEGKRFDLVCIKNENQIVVLELMRPGMPADYDHLTRLNRYVTKIEEAVGGQGTLPVFLNKSTYGLLIADSIAKDKSLVTTMQELRRKLDAITWDGLLTQVLGRYRDFLKILQNKSPEDPRIKGFIGLDES